MRSLLKLLYHWVLRTLGIERLCQCGHYSRSHFKLAVEGVPMHFHWDPHTYRKGSLAWEGWPGDDPITPLIPKRALIQIHAAVPHDCGFKMGLDHCPLDEFHQEYCRECCAEWIRSTGNISPYGFTWEYMPMKIRHSLSQGIMTAQKLHRPLLVT